MDLITGKLKIFFTFIPFYVGLSELEERAVQFVIDAFLVEVEVYLGTYMIILFRLPHRFHIVI